MGEEVEHLKCSSCGKVITSLNTGEEEIESIMHFDIIRSDKEFEVDEGSVEEVESNEKMRMTLCEECFLKACNESPTIGNLFLNEEQQKFIY